MVDNDVNHQTHVAFFHFGNQTIEIFHCAVFFHDIAVITNIVTVIYIRRVVMRIYPDGINPQCF
ncbi:hypothetical protein D3C80_2021070 [compost metagenome]